MKYLLGILSVTLVLGASDPDRPDRLTLDQAIEIVKSQNLQIKAADYAIQSAHADTKIATGYNWGKLDFVQTVSRSNDAGNVFGFKVTSREASFNDFGFDEFLANMGGLPGNANELLATEPDNLNYPDDHNFFQSKLTYMLPLYTGGKLSGYSDIAQAMERLKHLDKESVINEKIYEIRKSFYDMALLDSSVTHLHTILSNINILEHMTETMIEEGYAKKVDVLEVQAKRANVDRLIYEMESNKELLYHYLSFLLNREVRAIQVPAEAVASPAVSNVRVLNRNLDIRKAETGLTIREKMLKVSKAGYLPEIGAFAEYGTADDTFLGDAGDHKAYTVGARLTWNIFNGGIDRESIEKAEIEQLKMKTQVDLAKKGIALQIEKIYTDIKTYDFQIESLTKELELANQIYKNYEGRYREQLSSMSDVIIKQSLQIEKILELQMAKNKRNERIFALEKLSNGDRL